MAIKEKWVETGLKNFYKTSLSPVSSDNHSDQPHTMLLTGVPGGPGGPCNPGGPRVP